MGTRAKDVSAWLSREGTCSTVCTFYFILVCFTHIYLSSVILPYSFTGLLVYVYPPLGPFQGSMTHFSHTAPFGPILSPSVPPGVSCSTTVAVAFPVNAVQPIYQTTRRHTSEHISSGGICGRRMPNSPLRFGQPPLCQTPLYERRSNFRRLCVA